MAFQGIDEPGAAKAEDTRGKLDVARCAEELMDIRDGAVLIVRLFQAEDGDTWLIYRHHGTETR